MTKTAWYNVVMIIIVATNELAGEIIPPVIAAFIIAAGNVVISVFRLRAEKAFKKFYNV